MNTDIFAGIDIGSNAIRLLVNAVSGNPTSPDFKKVAFLRVPIRLGEDVFIKGVISEDKRHRLIEALQGFSHMMKAYEVEGYRAYATSAMRDASNGSDIVATIERESGIKIDIISGLEEADVIYQAGSLNSLMDKKRNYLYVDVGGGSTEVVVFSNQQKVTSESFQLGTVRMLVEAVQEDEVKRFKTWLKQVCKDYSSLSIIGSGGNINKVHKILGKRASEPHSYTEMKVLFDALKDLSYEERIRNYKLNTYRADVIIPALRIFLTIAKTCKVSDIYVPKVGVVDGIVRQLYAEKYNQ